MTSDRVVQFVYPQPQVSADSVASNPIAAAGVEELTKIVDAVTKRQLDALERVDVRVAKLRNMIAERKALLVAAIEEYETLAGKVAQGSDIMAKAVDDMHAMFEQAMRPTPEAEKTEDKKPGA
jgi:hypothetical protein